MLAAGRATRFGGGKLDAPCAGKPLGQWVLDAVAAAGLRQGVIVTGREVPAFAAASGWTLLTNPEPEQGLGTSLAVAARHALESGAQAMLVLLADMPLVTPDYLHVLVKAGASAATRHADDRPGVPALFGRDQFAQMSQLSGDRGAGPLLKALPYLTLLDPPAGMLLDIDRPEDLERAAAALSSP